MGEVGNGSGANNLAGQNDLRASLGATRLWYAGGASVVIALLPAVCLLGLGCDRSGRKTEHRYTFGVVGPMGDHPAWPAVRAGALSFAKEYPVVRVLTVAPPSDSPAAQQEAVASLLRERIHALAIWPVDVAAMTGTINDLANRGLPVATMGTDAPDSKRMGFVGWDEREVGRALAELAVKQIKDGRTLMILHAGQRQDHLYERWQSLRSALDRQQRLAVLFELDCGGVPTRARQIIADRMDRYPELSGWISINDWPLRGLADPTSLLPAGCPIVTCHPGVDYCALLTEEVGAGFVATDYFEWGWRAMVMCYSAVRTIPLEMPMYYPAVEQVTPANLRQWRQRWHGWRELRPSRGQSRTEQ